MGIVEALQVAEDRRARLSAAAEDVPIEQFALKRGEKRLGDSIRLSSQLHLIPTVHQQLSG